MVSNSWRGSSLIGSACTAASSARRCRSSNFICSTIASSLPRGLVAALHRQRAPLTLLSAPAPPVCAAVITVERAAGGYGASSAETSASGAWQRSATCSKLGQRPQLQPAARECGPPGRWMDAPPGRDQAASSATGRAKRDGSKQARSTFCRPGSKPRAAKGCLSNVEAASSGSLASARPPHSSRSPSHS